MIEPWFTSRGDSVDTYLSSGSDKYHVSHDLLAEVFSHFVNNTVTLITNDAVKCSSFSQMVCPFLVTCRKFWNLKEFSMSINP